jgi:HEAT repeat protein
MQALDDPEPIVRTAAVRALSRLGGARSAPALIRVSASDPAPDVRLEAVAAVGRLLEARHRIVEDEPPT